MFFLLLQAKPRLSNYDAAALAIRQRRADPLLQSIIATGNSLV